MPSPISSKQIMLHGAKEIGRNHKAALILGLAFIGSLVALIMKGNFTHIHSKLSSLNQLLNRRLLAGLGVGIPSVLVMGYVLHHLGRLTQEGMKRLIIKATQELKEAQQKEFNLDAELQQIREKQHSFAQDPTYTLTDGARIRERIKLKARNEDKNALQQHKNVDHDFARFTKDLEKQKKKVAKCKKTVEYLTRLHGKQSRFLESEIKRWQDPSAQRRLSLQNNQKANPPSGNQAAEQIASIVQPLQSFREERPPAAEAPNLGAAEAPPPPSPSPPLSQPASLKPTPEPSPRIEPAPAPIVVSASQTVRIPGFRPPLPKGPPPPISAQTVRIRPLPPPGLPPLAVQPAPSSARTLRLPAGFVPPPPKEPYPGPSVKQPEPSAAVPSPRQEEHNPLVSPPSSPSPSPLSPVSPLSPPAKLPFQEEIAGLNNGISIGLDNISARLNESARALSLPPPFPPAAPSQRPFIPLLNLRPLLQADPERELEVNHDKSESETELDEGDFKGDEGDFEYDEGASDDSYKRWELFDSPKNQQNGGFEKNHGPRQVRAEEKNSPNQADRKRSSIADDDLSDSPSVSGSDTDEAPVEAGQSLLVEPEPEETLPPEVEFLYLAQQKERVELDTIKILTENQDGQAENSIPLQKAKLRAAALGKAREKRWQQLQQKFPEKEIIKGEKAEKQEKRRAERRARRAKEAKRKEQEQHHHLLPQPQVEPVGRLSDEEMDGIEGQPNPNLNLDLPQAEPPVPMQISASESDADSEEDEAMDGEEGVPNFGPQAVVEEPAETGDAEYEEWQQEGDGGQ